MKIKGILEQNGTPTPDNPIPIKAGNTIIVKDKEGNIIQELPFDTKPILKEGDYCYKGKNGEWYIHKGDNMNYLKRKLAEKNMTQKELSIRAGIDKGSINGYCNKPFKRGMSIENAYNIAMVLDIDIKEFIEEILK